MSHQDSNPSSQSLQRSGASKSAPYRDDKFDTSRNMNGKRSQGDLREDQVEAPRKRARLDGDHHSERVESQQPSNPMTKILNPTQEQEFVDGPGHIVFTDERGKRCPAICFNKALLNTFTRIAVVSREVQERDGAIQKAQLELEQIRSSNQSAGIEKAKRTVEEAIKTQEHIEAGIPELVEARRRCDSLAQENKWSKLILENSREVAQFVIEQILNSENLLNIPTTSKPQEPAEVNKDDPAEPAPVPQETVHDTQRSNVSDSSLASYTTRLQSLANIEEQMTPRQLALRHFRFAADELDYRKGKLTFMQEEYAQAEAANRRHHHEQYPDRPASTTQTDIDLQVLQEKQKATRMVIVAEEAYDRTEQHAEALGLGDILADPHAFYWGENHNEFPLRITRSPSVFPVDRSRIEAWMASIPDSAVVDPQRQEDAELAGGDDWEAKSVEMFESVSVVACDMYRKKIDKWQELSGRFREGEGEGRSPGNVRRNPRRSCRGRQSPSGSPRTRS
ncbi:hypothetical protein HO133_007821 [Letharia lupina]|uniref:Uncharacterized protein n=1 Tax=Letharia lupina TaxID=560253 RepID=A0A8H6FHI4_9LECA|nr:uncharacterized protein HO133_007821 [Letharia lupina]KAF6228093.1 hypothetical protein HO133_007821 [Letharia lupina]